MPGTLIFKEFLSREAASEAAADLIAQSLADALGDAHNASLVVSGGSTPKQCFNLLSEKVLDWSRVHIAPSDERWVDPVDENSNEHLIRSQLMQGPAEAAHLLSFYRAGVEAAAAPGLIGPELHDLPRPFSCVLLGMGEDGHFASLFPDFDGLTAALDTSATKQCTSVKTSGSPFLRISLTLSALLDTSVLVLLFFGEAKRAVLQQAVSGEGDYPVQALLSQNQVPVTVIWAP